MDGRRVTITISRHLFDGAIFDLDGVLTDTAVIHAAAWKSVFDDFLRGHSARTDAAFRPFDAVAEYLAFVDGRSREDGVREFLASRGLTLPESATAEDSVHSLAARKDRLVQEGLRTDSVPLPGAAAVLRALNEAGIKVAVASASANCALVLDVTGLAPFVGARVDGIVAAQLDLPGKPHPALFHEAAVRLGVVPERAVVFEDALAGVEAGRRGRFGCVVGVARGNQAAALRRRGADVVVDDLTQVAVSA